MSMQAKVKSATAELDFIKKKYQVQLETTQGTIKLDLLSDVAPNHCKNMIGLAKSGFYDGLIFHRVFSGFMILGGCPQGSGSGGPGYNIDAEFNATPHVDGVLSMARSSSPNSAGSQFFVCLDKHTHLDRQYTAFGKTADEASLQVVRKIGGLPTASGDRPKQEVKITKVTVVET